MAKWTDMKAGVIHSATQRFWSSLGDSADGVAEALNNDPDFVDRLASFVKIGGYIPTTSQKKAREIMGSHYLGVEHAIEHLKASPSRQDLQMLEDVPFDEVTLESCKYTHVLVAVLPMSILDIQSHVDQTLFLFKDTGDLWYKNHVFTNDKGHAHWVLVARDILPDSKSKNWSDQQALISKDDERPTARVVVYTIILNYLVNGDRLLTCVYAMTSDIDLSWRIRVGRFDTDGIVISNISDGCDCENLGMLTARKCNLM